MKLKIMMENRNLSVDLNNEDAEDYFREFALKLLGVKNQAKDETTSTEIINVKLDSEKIAKAAVSSIPIAREEHTDNKYKGFMYICCPNCGETKGFNMKKESGSFYCEECGVVSPFEELLKKLFVNCECGERFTYWTNQTQEMFDIECLGCGTPVPIIYNGNKDIYETIRY